LVSCDAKEWIAEYGAQWFDLHEKSRVQKRMQHKILITNLREESRINVGIEDIFGKIYWEIGCQELLSKRHPETLRQVIFTRLLEPASKIGVSLLSL
jgi:hypothetical protein